MLKKTKIVATIGPVSQSEEVIEQLINAGVNVFRFNMKHATISWHEEHIAKVQKVANTLGTSIGILIDLQGPEIRLETRDQADIAVSEGDTLLLSNTFDHPEVKLVIPEPAVIHALEVGDDVLVDDGYIDLSVIEKHRNLLVLKAKEDYVIKHRKGVNLPTKHIDLPSLTKDDHKKLAMVGKTKIDFVALSFSRSKKDVEALRLAMKENRVEADIVAKIESSEALDNLTSIINSADAIMVARGDLGIEVPIEELAFWQKNIISKCRLAKKPVITATQMLQSMIENPRPTRAEATDVANAVFDGTDAVMLSAESASGKYPVRAVRQMAQIVEFCEKKNNVPRLEFIPKNNTELIVTAAMNMVSSTVKNKIEAVVLFTERGYSARVLSAFRPRLPVIAVSRHQKTVERLTLSFGVEGLCVPFPSGTFSLPTEVFTALKDKELIKKGSTILVIHGRNWRKPGMTSTLSLIDIE